MVEQHDELNGAICLFCGKDGAAACDTEVGGWYHIGCKEEAELYRNENCRPWVTLHDVAVSRMLEWAS